MKFTTIHLNDNEIEISNSILGKETIKLNGKVVSEKHSIAGAEHKFSMNENGKSADCVIKLGYGMNGVVFNLYVDNKPIVESPKSLIFFFVIGFIIVFAVIGVQYLLSR